MNIRMFSSKINEKKTKLETSVEWHSTLSPMLEKQMIATHVASFLDLYRAYSEEQLGLMPGLTKKQWLINVIQEELKDIKDGKLFVATVCIQDNLAGFITCTPVKARHEDFKTDVYVSLLAVKPFCYLDDNREKIHIGLGRQLIESVIAKFPGANTITLDTRVINTPGIAFYKTLGFSVTGKRTFAVNNPERYTGCEKQLKRSFELVPI